MKFITKEERYIYIQRLKPISRTADLRKVIYAAEKINN